MSDEALERWEEYWSLMTIRVGQKAQSLFHVSSLDNADVVDGRYAEVVLKVVESYAHGPDLSRHECEHLMLDYIQSANRYVLQVLQSALNAMPERYKPFPIHSDKMITESVNTCRELLKVVEVVTDGIWAQCNLSEEHKSVTTGRFIHEFKKACCFTWKKSLSEDDPCTEQVLFTLKAVYTYGALMGFALVKDTSKPNSFEEAGRCEGNPLKGVFYVLNKVLSCTLDEK